MNLGGNNTIGGLASDNRRSFIQLSGVAGIGVEQIGLTGFVNASELTITATVSDAAGGPPTGGGITKYGSQRLDLQGAGTYSGAVTVQEGVLSVQNSTALGTESTGTAATGTDTFTTTTTTVGPGIAQLQSLAISGAAGTFKLSFNGQTTTALETNTTAALMQAALNSLPTIGGVGGSVSVNQAGNVYTVSFGGKFLGVSQPQLTATTLPATTVAISTLVNGDGAALELQNGNPLNNGGVSTGLDIWYEHLVLNSPGNATFGDSALTVVSNDNMWRAGHSAKPPAPFRSRPVPG